MYDVDQLRLLCICEALSPFCGREMTSFMLATISISMYVEILYPAILLWHPDNDNCLRVINSAHKEIRLNVPEKRHTTGHVVQYCITRMRGVNSPSITSHIARLNSSQQELN